MAEPSKKPQDGAFQQQRLKAWQPLLTPPWVIGMFMLVGLVFIPIGIVIFSASNSVVEVSQRYDMQCGSNTFCNVNITIPEDMNGPIFFYYQLTNFYQNHRRYVKSRSDPQLRGIDVLNNLGSCDPLQSWNGTTLYPCGLIANSHFNDTFLASICDQGTCTELMNGANWMEKDIAWPSDISVKFKRPSGCPSNDTTKCPQPSVGPSGQLPQVDDEHFIVWMRTAGLPTFKKLYARMPDITLHKGQIFSVNVTNVFPVSSFSGEKAIVLSTTSWIGGKNDFLGAAYIVVGSICWFLAIVFYIKHRCSPRELGDMKYFNWPSPGISTGQSPPSATGSRPASS